MGEHHCKKPDRDEPRMVCGYPLPCPWHTVIVDATRDPPTVTAPEDAPITNKTRRVLVDVANAARGASKKGGG